MSIHTTVKNTTAKNARRKIGLTGKEYLPALTLLANIEDTRNGEGYNEYLFRKIDGRYAVMRISRSDDSSSSALYRALCAKNAALPTKKPEWQKLVSSVRDSRPKRLLMAAANTGWADIGVAFVGQRRVLGKTRSKRRLTVPIISWRDDIHINRIGTLRSWKNDVASAAVHSSLVQFLMAASFASPLLAIADWPSFILLVHGPSKSGKTTAMIVAATIIGICNETNLLKWSLTKAALQELATSFRDYPLFIDETKTSRDMKSWERQIIDFSYVLSGGSEDKRHSSWREDSGSGMFRSIAMLTSEDSLRSMGSPKNTSQTRGHEARVFDISAILPDAPNSIFDQQSPEISKEMLSKWQQDQVRKLRHACQLNHGTAYLVYIEYLIGLGADTVRDYIGKRISYFVAKIEEPQMSDIKRHASRSFGLIYAGGCLAIDAGLLPIDRRTLRKTIIRYFRESFSHALNAKLLQQSAYEMLKEIVRAGDWPTRKQADCIVANGDNIVGFREMQNDGSVVYHIRRKFLEDKLRQNQDNYQLTDALAHLYDNGRLICRQGSDPTTGNFDAASTEVFAKLGGKNHRWVKFKLPHTAGQIPKEKLTRLKKRRLKNVVGN